MSMNVWMCETLVYEHECMSMNVWVYEHVALCESRSWICPRLHRRPRHVVTPWLIKVDWLLHFASARASKNLVGFCNDARCLVLWVIDVNLRPDLNGEPMDSMHHQLLPVANFSQHNGENPLCPKSEGRTSISNLCQCLLPLNSFVAGNSFDLQHLGSRWGDSQHKLLKSLTYF